jgi:hypothetical protein
MDKVHQLLALPMNQLWSLQVLNLGLLLISITLHAQEGAMRYIAFFAVLKVFVEVALAQVRAVVFHRAARLGETIESLEQ